MDISDTLDAFQRRHPAAGFPLAVVYKFSDDQGNYLAALIAYYGFLSLFPLLLLLSTILGFVLQGDASLRQQVLDSTLHQFPIIGPDLGNPHHLGSGTGLVVGILGSLYGALGVAQAAQHAMNTAWAIPRNRRPNPIRSRLRSLLLLTTVGVAFLGTTVLSALGSGAHTFDATANLGIKIALVLAGVAINSGVAVVGFRVATARHLSVRDVLPGAVTAAVGWQLLQLGGATYVRHVVQHASGTNGTFALVLGLIAFIYVAALVLVLCVEANVVRVKVLHPRSLLTPFVDDVDLTRADRSAYAGQAKAQRNKDAQRIDVRFEDRHHDDAR